MRSRALLATAVIVTVALRGRPAGAADPQRFARLFVHYNAVRATLAGDGLQDVAYHAERIGLLALELARDAARSPDLSERAEEARLRAVAEAARAVQFAGDLDEARDAFARLSRALLEYHGEADLEDVVVVICPLHNRVWLQPRDEEVANPYMGAARAGCGDALTFRRPTWVPTRPSRPSPSEAPPPGHGRRR